MVEDRTGELRRRHRGLTEAEFDRIVPYGGFRLYLPTIALQGD
jgi:hypothetical protein